MSEDTPEYRAGRPELPDLLARCLRAFFQRKFGKKAWGRFTVHFRDGKIVFWEATQTGKTDN